MDYIVDSMCAAAGTAQAKAAIAKAPKLHRAATLFLTDWNLSRSPQKPHLNHPNMRSEICPTALHAPRDMINRPTCAGDLFYFGPWPREC